MLITILYKLNIINQAKYKYKIVKFSKIHLKI